VLNGRIYRAAFIPLLFALAIAGFSLTERTAPLSSSLAPEAFDGARAFADLQRLAAQFPARRPGSAGDWRLAEYVAQSLRGLGGTGKGGFLVTTHTVRAQTIDGERTLATVVAQRPGTTGKAPIVILAHRDAAGRGAQAELSGTAVLLELARVLAAGETQRAIVLVSTSGGSGGNAGAAEFAAHAEEWLGDGAGEAGTGGPVAGALVLGNLAGERAGAPTLAAFSAGPGSAPALLQSTVSAAIAQQTGVAPSVPGTLGQLAHLIFALPAGEQGPLDARGLPAVLVGVGGELPPPADEPVGAARLEAFGRAVLSAVYALDASPSTAEVAGGLAPTAEADLPVQHKAIPEWALRLLVAALLLPVLAILGDGFARLRRRREPVGRWILWVLTCGLPFLACAVFAILLGRIGALPAPTPPVSPAALPFHAAALEAALACALVLVLAWLGWPALLRRLGLPWRPRADVAGFAVVLVLCVLAVVVWAFDPLTALLLLPALHLWLVLASPWRWRAPAGRVPVGALLVIGLGVVPLALLVVFYAGQLDLGPGGVVHTALLLLAGGRVGLGAAVLWSAGFGCLAAAVLVALAWPAAPDPDIGGLEDGIGEYEPITIRAGSVGSKSYYAGPGSLGGTESALRR
jgi:hypothetical protein